MDSTRTLWTAVSAVNVLTATLWAQYFLGPTEPPPALGGLASTKADVATAPAPRRVVCVSGKATKLPDGYWQAEVSLTGRLRAAARAQPKELYGTDLALEVYLLVDGVIFDETVRWAEPRLGGRDGPNACVGAVHAGSVENNGKPQNFVCGNLTRARRAVKAAVPADGPLVVVLVGFDRQERPRPIAFESVTVRVLPDPDGDDD